MKRILFGEEHDLFREQFERFVAREVVPHQERWSEAGIVDRETWRKAGEEGFLCTWLPEEHGGPGGDFLHAVVVIEELAKVYEGGFAVSLHSDIVVPYLAKFGTPAQKERWLPGCAAGELVTALAMTEPGTGSDVAGIRTTAKKQGDTYVLDGAKTFISNGILCDLCVVAARTGDHPHKGLSLFVVEAGTPGFIKGKKLKKMGMASQDTCELAFDGCVVPAENLLGAEGMGFRMLMASLQQERLVVAIAAQSMAEKVLEDTVAYTKERKAFGQAISDFQNTQFKLAECATKIEVGRAFLDRLLQEHASSGGAADLVTECSMAKLWQTEMLGEVVDTCLQFFGGYGYMLEYPVTRAYMDARVQRIYAGTSEIMKLIIARRMGL